MLSSFFFSEPRIVFIMNLLSHENMKKEPLIPWPSPALNTLDLFLASIRDFWMSLGDTPASAMIFINFELAWEEKSA